MEEFQSMPHSIMCPTCPAQHVTAEMPQAPVCWVSQILHLCRGGSEAFYFGSIFQKNNTLFSFCQISFMNFVGHIFRFSQWHEKKQYQHESTYFSLSKVFILLMGQLERKIKLFYKMKQGKMKFSTLHKCVQSSVQFSLQVVLKNEEIPQ